MPKYGLIKNGELLVSENMLLNYKPIEYAQLPENFDEQIHYVTQGSASDEGDYIFVGVHLNELVLTDEEIEELPY